MINAQSNIWCENRINKRIGDLSLTNKGTISWNPFWRGILILINFPLHEILMKYVFILKTMHKYCQQTCKTFIHFHNFQICFALSLDLPESLLIHTWRLLFLYVLDPPTKSYVNRVQFFVGNLKTLKGLERYYPFMQF